MFSAVTSAFILDVQSQLQPDTGKEIAGLLRVLIYKIDNSTFENDPPIPPQLTGPSNTIVQVQAILFASLAVSLLSAFLAMLGKQWLNRYGSNGMRGTAIERCHDRQRKLDGMDAWYFDRVMESLPLMLQAALMLFGCGLSRYLWEISTIVASIVIGVTSFGVLFYSTTAVAGARFASCPYQTPGSRILRSAASVVASTTTAVASAFERAARRSKNFRIFNRIICLSNPCFEVTLPPEHQGSGHGAFQDLRCISWTLKTLPDRVIQLSTLEPLATMVTLADFDPTLVADCLDALTGYVMVANDTVVVAQGSEKLATASAMCLLRTFSHLSVMDPTSRVLGDVRKHYNVVFPPDTNFKGFPFCHTLGAIHSAFHPDWNHPWFDWEDYKPPSHEHGIFAHAIANVAQSEYRRRGPEKRVPGWVLRFALHSLSLDPPPPPSVVADCLSIIAIDLGCDVSNTGSTISDQRYVCI